VDLMERIHFDFALLSILFRFIARLPLHCFATICSGLMLTLLPFLHKFNSFFH
jgi:hypothetical protein